jgi:hypothetical protein
MLRKIADGEILQVIKSTDELELEKKKVEEAKKEEEKKKEMN